MSYWDKYKSSHEPKEHWSLRKKFLETHKDSFDEERLLCLAQVFYNVEFLGCRYPDAVMKQIEELSQGKKINMLLLPPSLCPPHPVTCKLTLVPPYLPVQD